MCGSRSSATCRRQAAGGSEREERKASHALAAEPATSAARGRLARADEHRRAGRVRGRGRRPARRARLRSAILLSCPSASNSRPAPSTLALASTTRSNSCATAASATGPSPPRRLRSWSASGAPARRCCDDARRPSPARDPSRNAFRAPVHPGLGEAPFQPQHRLAGDRSRRRRRWNDFGWQRTICSPASSSSSGSTPPTRCEPSICSTRTGTASRAGATRPPITCAR